MPNTRASPKWNAAIINGFEYTCAFPTMTCQHVCREKGLLLQVCLLAHTLRSFAGVQHVCGLARIWIRSPYRIRGSHRLCESRYVLDYV